MNNPVHNSSTPRTIKDGHLLDALTVPPYNGRPWWAPNGIAAIPTTAIDPPLTAASPTVPALIGSRSPYYNPCHILRSERFIPYRCRIRYFSKLPKNFAMVLAEITLNISVV